MSVIAKLRAQPDGAEASPFQAKAALSAMDRRIKRPHITTGRVIAGSIGVGILAVAGYAYQRYGLEHALAVDTARLTISPVEAALFADYVPVSGTIAPRDTVYLPVLEGGQVTEVFVDEGAIVEAGQPLARLKNPRLELEVLGREAQLTEQQNNLAAAQLAFEQSKLRNRRDLMSVDFEITRLTDALARLQVLEGVATPASAVSDLEKELMHNEALRTLVERAQSGEDALAKRNILKLEESIERMTESLQLVRDSLDNLTLTAPIAGQVTSFDLSIGQVVGAGESIGQIDAVGSFKVASAVDEFYLGRIASGQQADIEIAGRKHRLEVSKVYPNVNDRQFRVDLAFVGDAPEDLRRGQTVRPRIELGESVESLVVATGPFFDETGGLWLFAISPDGRSARRRDVTLGRRNPKQVEVVAGLREGERVITSSYEPFQGIERIDLTGH